MEIINIKTEIKKQLEKIRFYNESEIINKILKTEAFIKFYLPSDKSDLVDKLNDKFKEIFKLYQSSIIDYICDYIQKSLQ